MDREERFARWLDEGAPEELGVPDVAALLRGKLSDPNTWEEPPDAVFDSIMADIRASEPVELPVRSDTESDEPGAPATVTSLDDRRSSRLRLVLTGIAAALVLVVAVAVTTTLDRGATLEMALTGTELAPEASGTAAVIDTPSGFEIVLDVSGLEPAPPGFYYQAWLRNEEGAVTIGTFHAREGSDDVVLWSGVDVTDYPVLTVTIQEEGAGAESSGQVVLRGELER